MSRFEYSEKSDHVQVSVEPFYVEKQSKPQENFYLYGYTVKIKNMGGEAIKLISRHWIIMNGKGKKTKLDGRGVVGQTPILKPGETFEYTSACPLDTPTGNMRGQYTLSNTHSHVFRAKIPLFFFKPPRTIQ